MLAEIRNALSQLKNAERRVAETVLKSPQDLLESTITELAERAGVSEPTVVRFCKKLGLKGYMELRIKMAKDLPSDQYVHETVSPEDSALQVLDKMMNASREGIAASLEQIDTDTFEQAVDRLSRAGRIELYGLGGSGIIAMDAHHKFFRLGIPCIAYSNAHMQSMSASLLDQDAVAIVISVTGSSKDIVASAEMAKAAGAFVIGVIGRKKSPLIRVCDLDFSLYAQEAAHFGPMSTRIALLALLDALFAAVVVRNYDQVEQNLEKVSLSLVDKNL